MVSMNINKMMSRLIIDLISCLPLIFIFDVYAYISFKDLSNSSFFAGSFPQMSI